MKTQISFPTRRKPSAVALIIVLAMLVLITVLVISFFTSVTTEFSSSKAYASGESAKHLADCAVNVVMAQIKQATAGFATVSGTVQLNERLAWASQPGMIRTWSDGTWGNGIAQNVYKLYSSDNMILSGSTYSASPSQDPDQVNILNGVWKQQPSIYTDLNSPILIPDPSGTIVPDPARPTQTYIARAPIIDPNNLTALTSGTLTYATGSGTTPDIEGFSVTQPPATVYNPNNNISPTNNPVPMPVKWIYVLQDGSLAPASLGTSGSIANVALASSTNPIVGRIAFWTDDESCKVNVNTASEGTFWDVPATNNTEEHGAFNSSQLPVAPYGFSTSVPISNEFQRTPGHPAGTCLSTVLGTLLPVTEYMPSTAAYTSTLAPYYTLAPRSGIGGTEAGTQLANTVATGGTISLSNNRLYDSVDEIAFDPTARSHTLSPYSLFNSGFVSRAAFFLSAHSRAPEVNLFNLPRISLWPLEVNATAARNAKDNLLAFCSSIGLSGTVPLPYYFQRYQEAYVSGSNSDAAPGSSQSATADYQMVPRNQTLLNYLSSLTQKAIPGYGGTFKAKYPMDYEQILTEMFDYIRTGVNGTSVALAPAYNYVPFGVTGNVSSTSEAGTGSAVPIQITYPDGIATQGFGRTYTIRELGIDFMAAGWMQNTYFQLTGSGTPVLTSSNTVAAPLARSGTTGILPDVPDDQPDDNGHYDGVGKPRTNAIQAFVFLSPFNVNPGQPQIAPSLRYQIAGLEQLSISYNGVNTNLGFSGSNTAVEIVRNKANCSPESEAGFANQFVHFANNAYLPRILSPCNGNTSLNTDQTPEEQYFPFYSGTIPIGPGPIPRFILSGSGTWIDTNSYSRTFKNVNGNLPGTFTFSGGTVTVKIYTGYQTAFSQAQLIQSIPIVMPQMTLPLPQTVRAYPAGLTGFPGSGYLASLDDRDGNFALTITNTNGVVGTNGPNANPLSGGNPYNDPNFYTGYNRACNSDSRYLAQRFSGSYGSAGTTIAYPLPEGGTNSNITQAGLLVMPEQPYGGLFRRGDVIRSFGPSVAGPTGGDIRMSAALQNVPPTYFGELTGSNDPTRYMIHSLYYPDPLSFNYRQGYAFNDQNFESPGSTSSPNPFYWQHSDGGTTGNQDYHGTLRGVLRGKLIKNLVFDYKGCNVTTAVPDQNGAFMGVGGSATTIPGDWDNGVGNAGDGGYLNKADEGYSTPYGGGGYYWNIYYPANIDYSGSTPNLVSFSPSRQIASPVMFGSLPSGIISENAWQTLLFCPNPAAGSLHPGFGIGAGAARGPTDYPPYTEPPDHLFLDWFWMPVVEPYAISDPISTAGKVNINYQIVPFTYIERSTAVRAVLKNVKVLAIPPAAATTSGTEYKAYLNSNVNGSSPTFRYDINRDATISGGFDAHFTNATNPDIFHCASEICNVFLVPQEINSSVTPWKTCSQAYASGSAPLPPTNYASVASWWNNYTLTGANSRESPYNQIYPRITTKSNTFQVHYRVQLLKKRTNSIQSVWQEGQDQVVGEYRGSSIIERYIDPNDTTLPDFTSFATDSSPSPANKYDIDTYYHFRVVSTKAFTP